jgi:hypothetical protein
MNKKMKLNWIDYYINHCWFTGWQSIRGSFRIWSDLMCGNYQDYALMWYDDPYEECVSWFWQSLGDDDTLPKEFLEYLMQLADDVDTGKVKTYSLEEVMKELQELDLYDEDT